MSNLNFENIIKDKVKNFEYPLEKGAWDEFQNTKQGSTGSGALSVYKIIFVVSLFVIPILGIMYFSNNPDKLVLKRVYRKSLSEDSASKKKVTEIYDKTAAEMEAVNKSEGSEDRLIAEPAKKEKEYIFCPINDEKQIFFGPSEANRDNIKKFRMLIRDKKGRLIFESKNKNILWDGKIKNKNIYAKEGYYSWFIILVDSTNSIYRKNGKVKLVINQ